MRRSAPLHQRLRELAPEHELMPGDVALAHQGERLKTLLGSCVAVILTDPRHTVATMCHIVHTSTPNSANLHNTAYGICAMEEMFHRLRHVGLTPHMCQAYAYGGGNMFPHLSSGDNVGSRNARWVTDFLTSHNIALVDHSLGGAHYRKITWSVGSLEPSLVLTSVETGEVHGS